MATVALWIVGGLLAPFTGGASVFVTAGLTAAGAAIDSAFLFPAVFGRQQFQGPRIDDLHLQVASEGSPMNYCLGPENRVSGCVIYTTDLYEFRVSSGGGGGKGGGGGANKSYAYAITCAIGICEGPVTRVVKIWADGKLLWDANNPAEDKRYENLGIYLGTTSQAPSSALEALLGAGNVPAFRGTCYVVFEFLRLADFGNRMPQFTFLVEAQPAIAVRDCVGTILSRAGLFSPQWDATTVEGCCRGYNWSGPQKSQDVLVPLLNAYALRVQEENGVLKFFPRGHEAVVPVDANDLGTREASQADVPQLKITDTSGIDLPTSLQVDYVDPQINYQRGSVIERRINAPAFSLTSVQVPFVMSENEARQLAQRQLWLPWDERQTVEFSLPPKYIQIEESDVIQVVYNGNVYNIRVMELDRGANFLLQGKGVIQSGDTQSAVGQDGTRDQLTEAIYVPPTLDGFALDLPPLTSLDVDQLGIYIAATPQGASATYKGGVIYMGNAAGDTFTLGEPLMGAATSGKATTALAAGPVGVWDRVNTVTVQLNFGSLTSHTADEVLNGANIAIVGGEIIGFQTATLVGTRTYTLSGLLRGLRDTADQMGTGVNVPFVLLDADAFQFMNVSTSMFGQTRKYRVVPLGGTLDEADDKLAYFGGATYRPFSPTHLKAMRQPSTNDIVFSWLPRSRDVIRIIGGIVTPSDPDNYTIEIIVGSILKRTATITGARRFVYTAAMQSADGISTPVSAVTIKVRQVNSLVGAGKPSSQLFNDGNYI